MNTDVNESIRKMIGEELDKRLQKQRRADLVPIAEFCKEKKLNRNTLWRAEKAGKIKLVRIGEKKIFVDVSQFDTHNEGEELHPR